MTEERVGASGGGGGGAGARRGVLIGVPRASSLLPPRLGLLF